MSATTARVARALSGYFHVEPVAPDVDPDLYRVYSGSGARYEVDIGDGEPICPCEDWQQRQGYCKHILYILLTKPEALNEVVR